MLIGPQIHDLTAQLAAIIAQEPSRGTTLSGELIQHRHHVFATETLAHLDRDTFPREHVYHRQRAKPESIGQLVGHKVEGPGVIRVRRWGPMGPRYDRLPSSWRAVPQRQAFFAIEPIHQRLAHGPAFSIEEHANLPIAIPDPRLSHLPHALPESGARIVVTAIAIAGPRTADNPAGAPLTDRVRPA